jgi:hypothetical protein
MQEIKNKNYIIPKITIDGNSIDSVGEYGKRRLKYLESHDAKLVKELLLLGHLLEYLEKIDYYTKVTRNQIVNNLKNIKMINDEYGINCTLHDSNYDDFIIEDLLEKEIINR